MRRLFNNLKVDGNITTDGNVIINPEGKLSDGTNNFTLPDQTGTLIVDANLGTAASKNTGVNKGDIPILGDNGKLAESVIPAVAITDTYEAASQAAMLALSAQKGDICIRSDLNKSFVLSATPASTLANWKELKTPTDAVLSVNGETGHVELDAADVGAASSTHKHSYTPEGTVSLGSNTTASGGVAYIASVSGTAASGTPTTKYLHKTTTNVSPNAHTHTVTVSGTTGANNGTAIKAVTAVGANGTADVNYNAIKAVSLSASTTSTDGPAYVSSVSGGSAVTKTTKYMKFNAGTTPKSGATPAHTSTNTGANSGDAVKAVTGYSNFSGGSGSLTSNDTASGGIAYIASASHTAASLGTPNTGSAAPNGHTHSVTAAGVIDLGSNTEAEDGIKYVESVSGGSAVSKTTKYMKFNAGTTPKSGATPVHTSTATGDNSASETVNTSSHTHAVTLTANAETATGRITYVQSISGSAPSLTGTKTFITGVSGGSGSLTSVTTQATGDIQYVEDISYTKQALSGTTSFNTDAIKSASLSASRSTSGSGTSARRTLTLSTSTSAASKASVTITDGAVTPTLKYLHHIHNAASSSGSGTVGISGGSYTATTKYLSATTNASTNTVNVAKDTHTHNYDKTTSITLTAGTAPSMNFNTGTSTDTPYISAISGGSAVSSVTKYFHPEFEGSAVTTGANSGTAITAITGYPNFSGGSATHTTKYLHHAHTAASLGTPYTSDVAPNEHTHTYDKTTSVTLTAGTAPSLNFDTGTSTDHQYIYDVSGGSAVTTTTKYMKVGTTAADTTTVLTGVKVTSTSDVAPAGHTHSYGSSTALTTSANSGSAVTAITGLAANEEQATGDIKYLEDYEVSGGTVSGTTKYFHPSFSGTTKDTGEPK